MNGARLVRMAPPWYVSASGFAFHPIPFLLDRLGNVDTYQLPTYT